MRSNIASWKKLRRAIGVLATSNVRTLLSAATVRSKMRSNIASWKELQNDDYFENHPCYKGLVDMGDYECRLIESFLPLSPEMTVAVIGCGYGRETAHIAKRVRHVYGIDVSERILDKATSYLKAAEINNFTPVLAEKYHTEIPDGIDLVFSIVVMQHLTRDLVRDYFRTLGRKLSADGRLLVQFVQVREADTDADVDVEKVIEPSISWTTFQILDLVRESNLKLLQIQSIVATDVALWHWALAAPQTASSSTV